MVSAERRSDLMALFKGKGWEIAVIIEAQRHRDPRKQLVWPVYVARVRSRYGCPTWLLIVTTDPAMVDWCDAPMMS
ncbi:Hypothetical protein CAP_0812 [Chondromyces apiculatus DSM 436]|uniref:Uncharacterized protein n=1 Tax=Chondromyces apiculatus DSM 436 TaxID=1192034 RepID=A0A017STX8_9BACT|nr:Hypothetical protein CAP_0812 [Chondromyces apiculatus DSM 436]